MQIRSLEGLASRVSTDPELANAIKNDPETILSGIAADASALTTDKWTYRIVVLSLGFAVLIGMIGLIDQMISKTWDIEIEPRTPTSIVGGEPFAPRLTPSTFAEV